jgi:hypothetical protein
MKKNISMKVNRPSRRSCFIILALSLLLMYPLAEARASIGPFGGTVFSIAIDPNDPNTIYAGTPGGGIFKSSNGGENWSEVNTGLTHRTVRALVINPKDSNTVYAGTFGRGVFKSTDGGESWSEVNPGLTNRNVTFLAIDPKNSNTIYAGTNGNSIFASYDGGQTWN